MRKWRWSDLMIVTLTSVCTVICLSVERRIRELQDRPRCECDHEPAAGWVEPRNERPKVR